MRASPWAGSFALVTLADANRCGHAIDFDLTVAVAISMVTAGGGKIGGAAVTHTVHFHPVAAVGGQGDVQFGGSTIQLDGSGDVGEDGGDIRGSTGAAQGIECAGVIEIAGGSVQLQLSDIAIDTLGAASGVIVLILLIKLVSKIKGGGFVDRQ